MPKHYAMNHLILELKMRIVGVKAEKISSTKTVFIVKLLSPPSLKSVQIHLFCTSLEPKTKPEQGADLRIIAALKITNSGAKLLFDLGVGCRARSDTTRSMIAAFNSMLGATMFDASHHHLMTLRHQSRTLSVTSATQDDLEIQSAIPTGAPDPKHHGQVMWSAIKAEWIKSQTSEMDGL